MKTQKEWMQQMIAKGYEVTPYEHKIYVSKEMHTIGIYPDGKISESDPSGSYHYNTFEDYLQGKTII